LAGVRNPL